MMSDGNGHKQPAKLGHVRLQRAASDGWELWVAGIRRCGGLTTPQVTALIRGEVGLAGLVRQGRQAEVSDAKV